MWLAHVTADEVQNSRFFVPLNVRARTHGRFLTDRVPAQGERGWRERGVLPSFLGISCSRQQYAESAISCLRLQIFFSKPGKTKQRVLARHKPCCTKAMVQSCSSGMEDDEWMSGGHCRAAHGTRSDDEEMLVEVGNTVLSSARRQAGMHHAIGGPDAGAQWGAPRRQGNFEMPHRGAVQRLAPSGSQRAKLGSFWAGAPAWGCAESPDVSRELRAGSACAKSPRRRKRGAEAAGMPEHVHLLPTLKRSSARMGARNTRELLLRSSTYGASAMQLHTYQGAQILRKTCGRACHDHATPSEGRPGLFRVSLVEDPNCFARRGANEACLDPNGPKAPWET